MASSPASSEPHLSAGASLDGHRPNATSSAATSQRMRASSGHNRGKRRPLGQKDTILRAFDVRCRPSRSHTMPKLTDHIVFNDKKLEQKYRDRPMPMADLYEAYFDGDIDIPGDIYAFLNDRKLFVTNTLTKRHLKWAVTNFVPEALIHSKSQDERIVRE